MKPLAKDPIPTIESRVVRPRRTEVIVVSSDDGFLIELGPVLGDRYRTRPVDAAAGIAAVAAPSGQSFIVLDAGTQTDARATVARIEQTHPSMPIIVVAAQHDEAYWSAARARGAIAAVVARDELTGSAFSEALSNAEARVRLAAETLPAKSPPTGKKTPPLWMLGIATAVAVTAVGAWLLLRAPPARAPAAAVTMLINTAAPGAGAASAVSKPQSVLELLSAARVAFRDQKMLLPRADGEARGDSALELYMQVLAIEPANDEARDGLQRLFSVARSRIQSDLTANKLDEAARLLAAFKAANVDPGAVRELDATIVAARPKWLAAKAQESITAGDLNTAEQLLTQLSAVDRSAVPEVRRALEARKVEQQLGVLGAQVKAAIDAGTLIDPANDNARTRLQAMRQVSRNHALTVAAQRDLQTALLARAQEASRIQQFDVAQRLVAAAADINATAEVAEGKRLLQADIDANAQRVAAAAAAAKKTDEVPTRAAATGAAANAGASASQFIAAKPTQALKVQYPATAANAGVQGYVIVEFMLQPDGRAVQATVVDSRPARIFDKAATDAVASGRFDTGALTDRTPQRARLRLTFKPS